MSLQTLNESTFSQFITNKEGTVLVDFYADWCGPCKMMSPILEKINKENPNVDVVKINVDESNRLAQEFGIVNIPTVVVIKNSKVANIKVGLLSEREIINLL